MSSQLLSERPKNSNLLFLSASKVKLFDSCKAKFKYTYIEKLPRGDWSFLSLGKFLHETLEVFHKRIINGDTTPDNILMTESYKGAFSNWGSKLTEEQVIECKNILNGYLQILAEQKKLDKVNTVLDVEKPFNIVVDDKLVINGVIDRIQLDTDGILHIADYKSSKNDKYLKNDYFQLMVYCFAIMLENPDLEKIRTSYVMLKENFRSLSRDFTRKDIMKIEAKF